MSEADHDPREQSRSGMWTVVLLLLSPLMYVLSIGPVVALVEHGMLPKEPIVAFYTPVVWLVNNTPLKPLLIWYAAQWGWQ